MSSLETQNAEALEENDTNKRHRAETDEKESDRKRLRAGDSPNKRAEMERTRWKGKALVLSRKTTVPPQIMSVSHLPPIWQSTD